MATANLNNAPTGVITGNDSLVIVLNLSSVAGGRTLDVTGFADEVIQAGHVIIKETATGEYKPLPVTGTLPVGHTYEGILINSVLASKPFAGILEAGKVNPAVAKYAISAEAQTALSHIIFKAD